MNPTIITKPAVVISTELLQQLNTFTAEEGQVVVHCLYNSDRRPWMRIRIQPTTYLYAKGSAHRSDLLHVENIVMAPDWQFVPASGEAYFSLIFGGLPKDCTVFDLVELNEDSPFRAYGIPRNEQDVYFIDLE
jgi:hypothetical protein